jgi:hypothetical protein
MVSLPEIKDPMAVHIGDPGAFCFGYPRWKGIHQTQIVTAAIQEVFYRFLLNGSRSGCETDIGFGKRGKDRSPIFRHNERILILLKIGNFGGSFAKQDQGIPVAM